MSIRFSDQLKEIISLSRDEAERIGTDYIGTGHLWLGLIKKDDGKAILFLKNLGFQLQEFKTEMETQLKSEHKRRGDARIKKGIFKFFNRSFKSLPLDSQAEKAIRGSLQEATDTNSIFVEPEHLLLAMLKNKEDLGASILGTYEVNYSNAALWLRRPNGFDPGD